MTWVGHVLIMIDVSNSNQNNWRNVRSSVIIGILKVSQQFKSYSSPFYIYVFNIELYNYRHTRLSELLCKNNYKQFIDCHSLTNTKFQTYIQLLLTDESFSEELPHLHWWAIESYLAITEEQDLVEGMEDFTARLVDGHHNCPPCARHHLKTLQNVQRGGRIQACVWEWLTLMLLLLLLFTCLMWVHREIWCWACSEAALQLPIVFSKKNFFWIINKTQIHTPKEQNSIIINLAIKGTH